MLSHLRARWSNPRFFFAAEGAAAGGTSTETPKEPANLTEAKAQIAAAREEAKGANEAKAAAEAEVANLKAENQRLTAQFDTATKAAEKAQADLAAANANLATVTAARDQAQKDLTAANANVSRLEQLCGIQGVDPKAAVASQPANTGGANAALYDQWATATGAEKTKLWRANEQAIRSEAQRRAAQG